MFNRWGKIDEMKITKIEFDKLKDYIHELRDENTKLKSRCNYEHLVHELDNKTQIIKSQSDEISRLLNTITSLEKTINSERASAKLVLHTLDEASKVCERVINRSYIDKQLNYVHACDFRA